MVPAVSLIALALGVSQAVSAGCPASVPVSALNASLALPEAAQPDADLVALHSSTDRALEQLPCLREPVTRATAARFHRTIGLRLVVDREMEQARRAFAAARSVEPAYRFPETLVPQGNPVLDEYNAMSVDSPSSQQVPVPSDGYLLFDGREGDERPGSWPTVVQLVGSDGAVRASAWAWPDDPLPSYQPAPKVELQPATPTGPVPVAAAGEPAAARKPLLAAAGASAAASIATLVLSRQAASRYADPASTGEQELEQLRSRANGLLLASGGTAVLAVGLGVAATFTF